MADLIVGSWRNGLTEGKNIDIAALEKKHKAGFRMFPTEELAIQFIAFLDGYDEFVADLLNEETVEKVAA